MDVDELFKNLDAFYTSYKGKGKSKGKGKFDQGYVPYNYNSYGSKGYQKGDQKGDKGKGKGGKGKGKGKGKGPCWTCGDPDHQQRQCPKNKVVWNDQKWVYEVVPSEEEEQGQEEEREETEDQDENEEGDMATWSIEVTEPCKCVVPPKAPKRIKMVRVPKNKFNKLCDQIPPQTYVYSGSKYNEHAYGQFISSAGTEELKYQKTLEEVNRDWYKGYGDVHVSSLLTINEQDIVPIDSLPRSKNEYVTIEAAVDSAAGETVGPKEVFNMFPLKPSTGSISGRHYVSATKHRTPNLGERKVKFETDEGEMTSMTIQEADIGKVLISVDQLVENGNEVNLTRKNPHIKNLKTGKITKLYRKRGQFLVKMHIKINNEPVFIKQGRIKESNKMDVDAVFTRQGR